MHLSSRQSLAASNDALLAAAANLDDAGLAALGDDLGSVSALLSRESVLRRALSDSTTPVESKTGVLTKLFGGKVGPGAAKVLAQVVSSEWASGREMTDVIGTLGRTAQFLRAERDGSLDGVEDEIFRFGRVLDANPRLAAVLDDQNGSPAARQQVVAQLLGGKATPMTAQLLTALAADTRGRSYRHRVDELTEEAAQRRERTVAVVTSPVALNDSQFERLTAALAKLYNRPMTVHVQVDPSLQGGMTLRVGDEVIDGSVSGRLTEIRNRLAG